MPEGPEVEKLKRQLDVAWAGRQITFLESYWPSYHKFFKPLSPEDFIKKAFYQPILCVKRHGKWLEVCSPKDTLFAIHLGGTGWFLPALPQDIPELFPYKNFLHKVNEKAKRFSFDLRLDGFSILWDYYDGRTWGQFIIPETDNKPWDCYGPDWLTDTSEATVALTQYQTKGIKTVKQVLCDPYVASGVGNYLSCEACYLAGIRPNKPWVDTSARDQLALASAVRACVNTAMLSNDHSWWRVFKREGNVCCSTSCTNKISYEKDPGGTRGSYFCARCQG